MRWTVSCSCTFQSFRNEVIFTKSHWSLNYVVLQVTSLAPFWFASSDGWFCHVWQWMERWEAAWVCLITIQSQHEHISNVDLQSNMRVCEIRHPDDILGFLMELVTLCKYWHLVCGPEWNHPADCLTWTVLWWWWSSSCHVTVRACGSGASASDCTMVRPTVFNSPSHTRTRAAIQPPFFCFIYLYSHHFSSIKKENPEFKSKVGGAGAELLTVCSSHHSSCPVLWSHSWLFCKKGIKCMFSTISCVSSMFLITRVLLCMLLTRARWFCCCLFTGVSWQDCLFVCLLVLCFVFLFFSN